MSEQKRKRRSRSNERERRRRYSDDSDHQPHRSKNKPSHRNDRDSQSRDSRSRSQRAPEKKKIFGFEIFVDDDILGMFDSPEAFFSRIQQTTKIERIKFNPDLTIPDLHGRNVQVYDRDMERKHQSAKILLSEVYQKFRKIKNESFAIIIFVPEGMVSLLIGTKGHQINKIMKESNTTIVVNQPINRMTYRTVKIQGKHENIAKACRIIYQILEEKSTIAYSIQKEPSPLDYTKAKVKAKFILSSSVINYLSNKKKTFIKKTQDQTKCMIRFKEDSSRLLKRDQDLCILIGKLEDVQASLILLLTIVHQYYADEKASSDYTLKMLIPSNYVTKLIGQKGYMIRDIIERSGGAQIKILSEKQSQRDSKECIISINGTRENKIDASCLILEQIECFKNGGPILQSGKSINQNLAQQFKNSIPLRPQQGHQSQGKGLMQQDDEFIQHIQVIEKQDDVLTTPQLTIVAPPPQAVPPPLPVSPAMEIEEPIQTSVQHQTIQPSIPPTPIQQETAPVFNPASISTEISIPPTVSTIMVSFQKQILAMPLVIPFVDIPVQTPTSPAVQPPIPAPIFTVQPTVPVPVPTILPPPVQMHTPNPVPASISMNIPVLQTSPSSPTITQTPTPTPLMAPASPPMTSSAGPSVPTTPNFLAEKSYVSNSMKKQEGEVKAETATYFRSGQYRKQAGQIKREPYKKKRDTRSSSRSSSHSKSRSRSRDRNRRIRDDRHRDVKKYGSGNRSRSRSGSGTKNNAASERKDKDRLQLKIIVPKKLALDYKQLKYLEQKSSTEIQACQGLLAGQTEEAVIVIRGSIKQNNQCLRLIQKRLARINEKSLLQGISSPYTNPISSVGVAGPQLSQYYSK